MVSTSPSVTQELSLDIVSPSANGTVTTATIMVKGTTASLANIFVNDKETKADTQGNFSVPLTLDEGENTIIVVAVDESGKYTEKELTVSYEAEQ